MPLRSRFYALVLALFVTVTLAASAQDDQLKTASRQELDITKVLLAQEAAWNKGDLEAFIQGYKNSPDTLFVTHQVFRGVDGMLDEYRHNYPSRAAMGTLGFSELEVHPLDEKFAVVIGKYHLDRSKKDGGNADGVFSLVFEKTDQGWKIIVDHTS
ncbi:MAG TPA: nuclear transport factor 2 family protein [Edaphobacter sp.]